MDRHNLEEKGYQAIMEMIVKHGFKPGEFLLEKELTDTLNLRSRPPVRHAWRNSWLRAFLKKRNKKGYFIPFPNKDDAMHVFYAREYIEGLNTASAGKYRTADNIKELKELICNQADRGREGNKSLYSGINESFRQMIARISANPYLEQYSQHLFRRSSFYIFYFGSYYTEKDYVPYMLSPPQQRAIADAVEEGDAIKAKSVMMHHVHFTSKKVISKVGF